jgi:hypothetical protein
MSAAVSPCPGAPGAIANRVHADDADWVFVNDEPVTDEAPICSAKGCRTPAVWVLAWNNPKIHTPERRKTWLACDEHREHLSAFLGVRGFLKDVVTLDEWEWPSAADG